MKKRILILLLAVTAMLCAPPPAYAAKKTVYVIQSIKVKTASGRSADKITFTYNKQGLVSKRVWVQSGSAMKETFSYDEKGRIKTRKIYLGRKVATKYSFHYSGDQLVSCSSYSYETKEKYTISYFYDEKGRLSEIQDPYTNTTTHLTYDSEDHIQVWDEGWRTKKYSYDSNGNVIKEYWDGQLFRRYKNRYVGKTTRLKQVAAFSSRGKKICTDVVKYKKMKISSNYVPAVQKQQIQAFADPVFEMFPY